MNSAARSGSTPIMVRNVEPSSVTSYAIEPMTHGRAGLFRRLDPEQQFFERCLRLDDDGVGARIDQRLAPAR